VVFNIIRGGGEERGEINKEISRAEGGKIRSKIWQNRNEK
jgi:hypothetical protein